MNTRNTVIIFLVFVALAALAYTLRDTESTQVGEGAPTPTPEALLELEDASIEEVTVEGEDGSYVLSRVAGGWEVDGEEASDEVDGLVSRLASPVVRRELPPDRDPETYGFATPTLTITLATAAGDRHVLLVGDEVPAGFDVYVRLAPGEGEGGDVSDTRIVIVGGSDIDRLREWILEPPLRPTPTPEPTEEGAADDEDEAVGDADADAEAGGEDATADGDADDAEDEAVTNGDDAERDDAAENASGNADDESSAGASSGG